MCRNAPGEKKFQAVELTARADLPKKQRNWHRIGPFDLDGAELLGSTGATEENRLMRNKLLITTAAVALVAGTVFAGAQEQKQGAGRANPSGGASQMQHQQGAQGQIQHQQGTQGQRGALGQQGQSRTTGQGREESRESKQGQIHENERGARQGQREQGNIGNQRQRGELRGTTGQAEGRQGQNEERRGRQGERNRTGVTTGQRPETQQGQVGERGGREGQVGGRGVNEQRGGNVTFSNQQRTRIRQSVLEGRNVPRVGSVNFSLSAGTVVPERIHVVPVPSVLVEYHPAWRGYFYFVVGDQIIIVDRRHRIVAVVPV